MGYLDILNFTVLAPKVKVTYNLLTSDISAITRNF